MHQQGLSGKDAVETKIIPAIVVNLTISNMVWHNLFPKIQFQGQDWFD
jgi:hypothetical protein